MSESEAKKWVTGVEGLVTRLDGLEERLNGLETRINERFEESERQRDDRFKNIEKHIDDQFEQVNNRLEKIDDLLRGKNGNPGMNGRLNHVEKMQMIFLGVFLVVLGGVIVHYLGLIEQLKNLAFAG